MRPIAIGTGTVIETEIGIMSDGEIAQGSIIIGGMMTIEGPARTTMTEMTGTGIMGDQEEMIGIDDENGIAGLTREVATGAPPFIETRRRPEIGEGKKRGRRDPWNLVLRSLELKR